MKVNIAAGTAVKISPESRALLERAHNDGLIEMYENTFSQPIKDKEWKYFMLNSDNEWMRSDSPICILSVEELEKMLYPVTHNLVSGDSTPITRESHIIVRELAKKYNIPMHRGMEEDTYEKEMSYSTTHYKYNGSQIIRNSNVRDNGLSLDVFILKMMGLHKPSSIEVKLNENHTATVTKDSIKVGCQTFPHSVVGELQKAIEEMTK